MFVNSVIKGGVLQGWLKDDRVDLFVWFDAAALSHAQIAAGRDLAEWQPPAKLTTGLVRESDHAAALADGVIDFDRRPNDERLARLRAAVDASDLSTAAKALALALLERGDPTAYVEPIHTLVANAMPGKPRRGLWALLQRRK